MHGALPLKKTFIYLALFSTALFVLLHAALMQFWNSESDIRAASNMRFQSHMLADELHQSSDDLTRMARSFVVTGDPAYEQQYHAILDIRNGKRPRPLHYERGYWDLVTADNPKPSPDGETIALVDLMKAAGFTSAEFAKLKQAQDISDGLVVTELTAMNAAKGIFADASGHFTRKGPPDLELARRLMFDAAYKRTKARILAPVNEFHVLLDARTDNAVERTTNRSRQKFLLVLALIALSLAIMLIMFAFTYHALKKADKELSQHRDRLADMVAAATAKLEQANKELEAFSYSVSHDLRAPLRAIDGFAQILGRKYASLLDSQGQDYLQRVQRASQRMGELIDDILHLSRVSRQEIVRSKVDISGKAHEIARDLRHADPAREVEFTIASGMTVDADPKLIRIVLENLIGNAWKFTSKRSDARIEVGMVPDDGGGVAVFVRDNGAGFSMNFAHKLFSAFQRLHAASDFAGHGIGLATVQRIIRKHGGRTWAEGKEGEGATFYFSCGVAAR